jgi:uncharacterized repeat protein (TIGR03803 family)
VAPPGTLTIVRPLTLKPGTTEPFYPLAGLTLGDDGAFYGVTCGSSAGQGAVFRMTLDGNLTVLHTFIGDANGACPRTTLAKDRDGAFYGTTGGAGPADTAFRITPDGKFTSFGRLPGSGTTRNKLLFASDGNLYGTTEGAPSSFFRMTTAGVMTVLYQFKEAEEGITPTALVEGPDGNFYATTRLFGRAGAGSFFSLTPDGSFKILVAFPAMAQNPDGSASRLSNPTLGGLVLGGDGNFYGAVDSDGVSPALFKVSPSGALTKLVRLVDKGIGSPQSAMIQASDGNFYGATMDSVIYGSIFQVTSTGALTVLYQFKGDALGNNPAGGRPSELAQGPDGFYGTTQWSIKFGSNVGGEVFKLSFGAGGGSALPPAATPALEWIDAVDPNQNNLRSLVPSATRGWDPKSYAPFLSAQPPVKALTADGATLLVLRTRVSQQVPVKFSIADPTCNTCETDQVGSLCTFENFQCGTGLTNVTVTPQQLITGGDFEAFAVLRAPVDFARGSAPDEGRTVRQIQVTAALGPSTTPPLTLSLTLWRPPVVLLHGLWSNKDTWDWPIQHDQRFLVFAEDYRDTNAARFLTNLEKPKEAINYALGAYRANGIAATQVDFVGHSMGGVLARFYAGEYSPTKDPLIPYYRDDNLGAGDIHKLITLDTPHMGSELADQLVDEAGMMTPLGQVAQPFLQDSCVSCGAVSDLRTTSPILRAIPAVKVPSHAIVGVGGQIALLDPDFFIGNYAYLAPTVAVSLALGSEGLAWDFFNGNRHDTIVSEPSQTGGLTGDAVTIFDYDRAGSGDWWAVHTSVTKEARIGARVIDLLNAPAGSSVFARFGY